MKAITKSILWEGRSVATANHVIIRADSEEADGIITDYFKSMCSDVVRRGNEIISQTENEISYKDQGTIFNYAIINI